MASIGSDLNEHCNMCIEQSKIEGFFIYPDLGPCPSNKTEGAGRAQSVVHNCPEAVPRQPLEAPGGLKLLLLTAGPVVGSNTGLSKTDPCPKKKELIYILFLQDD